jgi:hypothetical protein
MPPMDCLPDALAVVGDRFETLLSLLEDELSHTEIDEVSKVHTLTFHLTL